MVRRSNLPQLIGKSSEMKILICYALTLLINYALSKCKGRILKVSLDLLCELSNKDLLCERSTLHVELSNKDLLCEHPQFEIKFYFLKKKKKKIQ